MREAPVRPTLKGKDRVEEVVLFGSKARWDDDPYSDIDFLLVTARSLDWRERQTIIHSLFDPGMRHGMIFSIPDTKEFDFDKGIFATFPIYKEIKEAESLIR
jgi:hypothetical protein